MDFSGLFFKKFRIVSTELKSVFSTVISVIICKVKGIGIDINNKYYGLCYFYRTPGSRINIGRNNTFRSDKKSNLIGINRKCIISTLRPGSVIVIGDKCGFSGTVIGSAERIIIGNSVMCGANTTITDTDWHPVSSEERLKKSGGMKSKPVIIKDNVWLGLNSIVLKGVTIGENTIIGPNSVVVRDIPSNVIASGNPCSVIKNL